MADSLPLTEVVELTETIKDAYRATWDETRYRNERTGEVSPTRYDVTLVVKGGGELYFCYDEVEGSEGGSRKWQMRKLGEPAGEDWKDRHVRPDIWVVLPDGLASLLWDVVTVHGAEANKRGWSEINRDGVPVEPESEKEIIEAAGIAGISGLSTKRPGRSRRGDWTEVG